MLQTALPDPNHVRPNPLNSNARTNARRAELTPVSLQQMILFGQQPSQGTLLKASEFLSEELPIRLSHRVVELESLPDGLAKMPSIQKVKEWYAQSFEVRAAAVSAQCGGCGRSVADRAGNRDVPESPTPAGYRGHAPRTSELVRLNVGHELTPGRASLLLRRTRRCTR